MLLRIRLTTFQNSQTPQTRIYFSMKQTDPVLIIEGHTTFSGCSSYHKDTYDYDKHVAIIIFIITEEDFKSKRF